MQIDVRCNRIKLVAVGRPDSMYSPVISMYEKRIKSMTDFTAIEIKGVPNAEGLNKVREKEAQGIRGKLRDGDRFFVFDVGGEVVDTDEFAALLLTNPKPAALIIGGALGLDDSLHAEASKVIALGRVTLPHQLARLVVTEQVYRAMTIARGIPYHH